ncbi:MAG: hypothetical protein WCF22_06400 [Candidatus Sulfotelmatobacter sp.]
MSTDLLPVWGVDLKEQLQLSLESVTLASKTSIKPSDALSQSVADRFRCPGDTFDFVLQGWLSSDKGYFRFGPNTTCYGRSCRGTRNQRLESSLYDVLDDVVLDDAKVSIPFDPSEVISNLLMERYAGDRENSFDSLLKKAYYLLRPLTNLALRKRVQRFRAGNWRDLVFPRWPVDTTVENLCESLLSLSLQAKGVDSVPFVWFWPRGAQGCVMMTHDVETEAGRDFCASLMDMDDAFGIKASFQIVPEQRYTVPRKLITTIRDRGFEMGIQDLNHDGRLFDNKDEFLRRAAIINRYAHEYAAKGFRSGVLYRNPDWYKVFDFSFDMSVPNVAHLDPQRGGCCTVMPYFIGNILELPLTTTQDYTLFHILNERCIDLWKNQIDLILEKNGLASFIVHPDYILERGTMSVYENLLGYLQDLRARTDLWFALPSEIDSWWRSRSQMRVEGCEGAWRIVGEGAERARLAYAKNIDGKLVYEVPEATKS